MAEQAVPMLLPPGYVQGQDVDDSILLQLQSQFIDDLPDAVPGDANFPDCTCGATFVYRTGPTLRRRVRKPQGENPLRLPCGHVMCEDCLQQWLSRNNHCIYCRAVFFLNPRWPANTRAGIRDYYDRYWETHRWEMRPMLEQEPLENHTASFKNTLFQHELAVIAQVFMNELIHALPGSRMGLTHQANIDYTEAVQDSLEQWVINNNWAVRLRDDAWRPADVFDQVNPEMAAFVRRIGNLTAEFLNRARSVEFTVQVDNSELFRSLVVWLFQVEGIDPNDHDGWRNQAILCMVHCLSHVAQDEDVFLAWDQANVDFLKFQSEHGGPYPPELHSRIRHDAGVAAIAEEDTTFVNENYVPYYRNPL